MEQMERGKGKMSRRGVKSQYFITKPPDVITKIDVTLCFG